MIKELEKNSNKIKEKNIILTTKQDNYFFKNYKFAPSNLLYCFIDFILIFLIFIYFDLLNSKI